ncbi:hypothetical protein HDF10_000417 [Edaphobacter lichenicola]|uniref:Uncharacterized protein n=1 Tax=Tunturiibacter lichenicola TaxID=2051959 RepID=A0A7W8N1P1_9BACT|nr:hypothetical protein [Edaphobacter lichenicola]
MIKYAIFIVILLASTSHAFAQWGQCDPLNRDWFEASDSVDYPTIENICTYPPK